VTRLGFAETLDYGGQALFVSAGGYHHHMAMNVWNSAGAGRRQRTLGLGRVDIVLPGADDLGELQERMAHYGLPTRDTGASLEFDDPWSNLIRARLA
jgi:catechol 2,3-dioxygenase